MQPKTFLLLAGLLSLASQPVVGQTPGVVCNYSYGTCTNGTQTGPLIIPTKASAVIKKQTPIECPASKTQTCGTECQYSAWAVTEAINCTEIQTRSVTKAAVNGGACSTYLKREVIATPTTCAVSDWKQAGDCSETDGTALYKREIVQPTACMVCTAPLEERRFTCPAVDCKVSDWVLGACNPETNTKIASKSILTHPRFGGAGCPPLPTPREIPCDGIPCVLTEWGTSESFTETCRENVAVISWRGILQPPEFGGKPCDSLVKVESCPNKECVLSNWSCGSCDPSTVLRTCTRTVTKPAQERGGCGPTTEFRPCRVQDCKYSAWSAWSCDVTTGMKSRTREIISDGDANDPVCSQALTERKPCDRKDCVVSEWTCGADFVRSRTITEAPMFGGKECPHLFESCAPKHCILSPWHVYSPCTSRWGSQQSSRKIIQEGANGGKTCPKEPWEYHRSEGCI